MTKDGLIFDWSEVENHRGRKLVAFLVVCLLAIALAGLVEIRFFGGKTRSSGSASVMHFADDEIGHHWRMKAEEEGPFPGGMRLTEADDLLDFRDSSAWNEHVFVMRSLEVDDRLHRLGVLERGTRYFPDLAGNVIEDPREIGSAEMKPSPVILPYEKEALAWLPEKLPPFQGEAGEYISSNGWRFILQLRSNGSVEHCLPMSGGEAELSAIILWLEGIRFEKSDEEIRWMALRVEFINSSGNGSDPK